MKDAKQSTEREPANEQGLVIAQTNTWRLDVPKAAEAWPAKPAGDHDAPVTEFILALYLQPMEHFGDQMYAKLGQHELLSSEYPKQQKVLLGAPVVEVFLDRDSPELSVPQPLPTNHRVWYISKDDVYVVQSQFDRLILNWRRRRSDQEYPGYHSVRERFDELLKALQDVVHNTGATLTAPWAMETTYVNTFVSDGTWNPATEIHKRLSLGSMQSGELSEWKPEQVSLQMTKTLKSLDGESVGRARVDCQPTYSTDGKEVLCALQVTNTARRFFWESVTLDQAIEELDRTHLLAKHSFFTLLSTEEREKWEL